MKTTTTRVATTVAAKTQATKALTAKQIAAQAAKTAKFFAEQEAAKPHLQVPEAATLSKDVFSALVATAENAVVEVVADIAKTKAVKRTPKPEQNGVKMYLDGTLGAQTWAIIEQLKTELNRTPTITDLRASPLLVGDIRGNALTRDLALSSACCR